MKRIQILITAMILALVLAACGTANDNKNDNLNNDVTNDTQQGDVGDNNVNDHNNDNATNDQGAANDNQGNDGDMKQRMEDLNFTEFDLKVEYGDDNEYEAELKLRNDRVEADLEDDLNNVHEKGQDAFDKIYPLVEKLNIDKDTDKADAIKQTLEAFGLDNDYTEFELEIDFDDGTKVEFEDKK